MDKTQRLGMVSSNSDSITHFGVIVWGAAVITWGRLQTGSELDFSVTCNSSLYLLRQQIWRAFQKSSWRHMNFKLFWEITLLSSHDFNSEVIGGGEGGEKETQELAICHHSYSPCYRLQYSSDGTPDWCRFIAQVEYICKILLFAFFFTIFNNIVHIHGIIKLLMIHNGVWSPL